MTLWIMLKLWVTVNQRKNISWLQFEQAFVMCCFCEVFVVFFFSQKKKNGCSDQFTFDEVHQYLLDPITWRSEGCFLLYRKSQHVVGRPESESSHALCKQMQAYRQLREKWQIGHIECRSIRMNGFNFPVKGFSFGIGSEHMQIFSHFKIWGV